MPLSSLQGAAVTSIKIENVLHEFSSLAGAFLRPSRRSRLAARRGSAATVGEDKRHGNPAP